MPRTRFDKLCKPQIPPANYFEDSMRRYMRAQKLHNADIAARLGCTGANVGHMLKRPARLWSADEVQRYAAAVNMPLDEAFSALAASLKGGAR